MLPDPSRPGFSSSCFDRDFNTNANGSFNTSTTPHSRPAAKTRCRSAGWQCNQDSNVNSKIDIVNAYATSYTAQNGDQILYFGLERNANTGDANVGFWFLQDANVNCESIAGSTATFTGDHLDGDLLIVSAFTAAEWSARSTSTAGTATPSGLWTDPCRVSGVDCRPGTLTRPGRTTACATAEHRHGHYPVAHGGQARRRRPQPPHRAVLRGRPEPDRERPRRELLQHVPRRHPLLDVADRNPVRLRPRPARSSASRRR